jgi:general nucleoside transport system ATP-binding protein
MMQVSTATTPLLEMRGISKYYGDLAANDRVDFSVRAREIHALLGENGAGKTTLMRILSGFAQPDAGEIRVDGRPVRIRGPQHAMSLSIGMVHQHWRLVERFTVAENLMLGHVGARDRRDFYRQIASISDRFGLKVRPNARVWELSLGERQRVEILRVLQRGARILVLDEPTAVLSPQETDQLFKSLREMVADGTAIVFISHKMKEVIRHCDRVTVMRRGRVVGERDGATATAAELADLTIGRVVAAQHRTAGAAALGAVALELDDVHALSDGERPALKGVSFALRGGEILGIAGVSGNGQKELADVCAGLRQPVAGTIRLNGSTVNRCGAASINRAGLSFVPEDRMGTGVCPDLGVADNLILRRPQNARFARYGVINWATVGHLAMEEARHFDIRLSDPWSPIRTLSGGNVQKVVLAREFSQAPKVLVAAQPTRGLDVAATEFVHTMLDAMRDRGGAVLLISDDLDEIIKLSNRFIVIYGGQVMAEFPPHASRELIGLAMTGAHARETETASARGSGFGAQAVHLS